MRFEKVFDNRPLIQEDHLNNSVEKSLKMIQFLVDYISMSGILDTCILKQVRAIDITNSEYPKRNFIDREGQWSKLELFISSRQPTARKFL